jgi:hypothetical protein
MVISSSISGMLSSSAVKVGGVDWEEEEAVDGRITPDLELLGDDDCDDDAEAVAVLIVEELVTGAVVVAGAG